MDAASVIHKEMGRGHSNQCEAHFNVLPHFRAKNQNLCRYVYYLSFMKLYFPPEEVLFLPMIVQFQLDLVTLIILSHIISVKLVLLTRQVFSKSSKCLFQCNLCGVISQLLVSTQNISYSFFAAFSISTMINPF